MNHPTVLSYLAGVTARTLGLAAIAWIAIALCRIKSPAVRHAIWSMVAVGMLLLAAVTALVPVVPLRVLPARPVPVVRTVAAPPVIAQPPNLSPLPPSPRPFPWDTLAAGLYLAGAILCAGRLVYAYLLTRRLVAASRPLPDFAAGNIYESACISVPLTLGWLRPRILLPEGWRVWPPEKLDAVLIHERTHIARADWAVAVLAGVTRCAFWFHPLAWWIERHLISLAEQACDDASLAHVASRECYAQTLVDMAAAVRSGDGRVAWEAMAMAKAAEVRLRVERILDDSRQILPGLTRARWLAVGLCALPLVYTAAVVRPVRVRAQQATPASVEQIHPADPSPQSSPATAKSETPALQQARAQLDRLEEQITEFKAQNTGRLPEQVQNNLAQLNTVQMTLAAANESINHLRQQKLMLETQLQNNYTKLNFYNALLEQRVPGVAQMQTSNESLMQITQKIEAMREEIAALQEQLSPNHPALKRAQSSLAALQAQRQQELQREAAATPTGSLVEFGEKQQANLAILELNASNNVLKTDLQNLSVQMDTTAQQIQDLTRQLADYQSRVESSPKLEQQYASLLRDQSRVLERLEQLLHAPAPTSGPTLLSRRDPEYTPQAKQAGIQGTVELSVTIGTDGVARDIQVIRKLDAGLDRKAIECVKSWRFRPASRDGQPVSAFATVEVKFRLP